MMHWVREIVTALSFWAREIAGWLLVAVALYLFFISFLLLNDRLVFEAGPLTIIGIVVFRGGIHLLKVAVAARLCTQARDRAAAAPPVRR